MEIILTVLIKIICINNFSFLDAFFYAE